MNSRPISIIYSPQTDLIQKISGYLYSSSEVIDVSHINSLFLLLEQHAPAILFVDMIASQNEEVLQQISENQPQVLIIAIGDERSDPMLMAQTKNIFTAINPNSSKQQIQSTFQMASRHLDALQECEMLRQQLQERHHPEEKIHPNELLDRQTSIREALQSFTQFDDIDALLNQCLKWLRHEKSLGSIGIFLKNTDEKYSLKKAFKVPQIVKDVIFDSDDAFITWLHYNPIALTSANVEEISDLNMRKQLKRALKVLFADVILPLHVGEYLLGWIFFGKKATGKPLNNKDIIEISLITDQLGIAIEKCNLQQQIAKHKLYFENILNSLPASLVLFDQKTEIIWWNNSASVLIDTLPKMIKRCAASNLNSKLSNLIYQACSPPYEASTLKWEKPKSNSHFLVESIPCFREEEMQSGFLLIHDITSDALLEQNNKKYKQANLASELAQKLSVSIRSPLVTIKTFVQLLPERSHDKEFQNIFIKLVSEEVTRLQNLSNDIQKIVLGDDVSPNLIKMQDILRDSISSAITMNHTKSVGITSSFDHDDIFIQGDSHSLVRCFSQIISGLIQLSPDTESTLKINLSVANDSLSKPCCVVRLENPEPSNKAAKFLRNSGYYHQTNGMSHISQLNDIWHITDLSFIKKILANHAATFKMGSRGKFNYVSITLPLGQIGSVVKERNELS